MSKMSKKGYTQGDMSPSVEDYQKPMSNYSQEGFSKTTQYIERQDKTQNAESAAIKRQGYKGRYS